MNDTKKLGRPKKFDRDAALAAAITVFWRKGYEGASMKDLTQAMGINGPSLYATFGDKHALYLQAIDAYTSNQGCEPLLAFESQPDILEAVKDFFLSAIAFASQNDSGAKGCFLSSCVATSSGHVEGVQPVLKTTIEDIDQRLSARFEQEKQNGTLPANFPCLERARLMFDLRQGYVLRARAEIDPVAMAEDIERRSALVLAD